MTTKETTEEFETNADLREAYDRQKVSTSVAEGKLEAITFKALDLDPDKGIGKAFKMTYEGQIEPGELPAIQEALATEFDYTPPSASKEPETEPPKSVQPDISEAEKRVKQMNDQSDPAPINQYADQSDKAAEAGDWAKVFEIGLNEQGVKFGELD